MGRRQSHVILILAIHMLSIGTLGKGQGNYYLNLAREDYYVCGGEPEGTWLPTAGGRTLGLSDAVSKKDLRALFRGYAPDGTPLVQNAGDPDRRPGHDLTFSAPKTVSVLWAVAFPETRRAIQACQLEAVTKAIQYVEREAAFSRRGKAGSEMAQAGIVVAAFEHGTSRALDCQLHTHALVLNVATRDDGTTGSLHSMPLYLQKMVTGAIYRAQLAHLLQERLGLQIVREGTSFEIAGVPSELCDHFSKRRHEIEKTLGEKRVETAAAAAVAALATREAKGVVPPRSELFAQWQQTGRQFGFTAERARRLLHQVQAQNSPEQANRVVDATINSISQRVTSFRKDQLLRKALFAAVEYGLSPALVRRAVDGQLHQRSDVSQTISSDADPMSTTTKSFALQKSISQSVRRMRSSTGRLIPARITEAAIERFSKPRNPFTEELKHHVGQIVRAAMRQDTRPADLEHIARQAKLTLADAQRAVLRDLAGNTGRIKTLSRFSVEHQDLALTCAREIWQKAGYRVIGTSLSRAGAARLEQETGIESMTLKRLELRMHPTRAFQLRHHARQLLRAAQHKTTYTLDRLQIDKRTLLVVDAADCLTLSQMESLARSVAKQGGQLLLVQSPGAHNHGPSNTAFHAICRQLRHPEPSVPLPLRRPRDQVIGELLNKQMENQDGSRRYE